MTSTCSISRVIITTRLSITIRLGITIRLSIVTVGLRITTGLTVPAGLSIVIGLICAGCVRLTNIVRLVVARWLRISCRLTISRLLTRLSISSILRRLGRLTISCRLGWLIRISGWLIRLCISGGLAISCRLTVTVVLRITSWLCAAIIICQFFP